MWENNTKPVNETNEKENVITNTQEVDDELDIKYKQFEV